MIDRDFLIFPLLFVCCLRSPHNKKRTVIQKGGSVSFALNRRCSRANKTRPPFARDPVANYSFTPIFYSPSYTAVVVVVVVINLAERKTRTTMGNGWGYSLVIIEFYGS